MILVFSVLICYRTCREEQLSRGTIVASDIVAKDIVARELVGRDIVARDFVARDMGTGSI